MSSTTHHPQPNAYLSDAQKQQLTRLGGGLAIAGILAGIAGLAIDHERFAFSYLIGFLWITTLGLGALFFVLIQHVTRAGWSVAPRRPMEWLSQLLPLCAVLFLPVAFFSHDLYHHWMSHEAAADELLVKKSAYLNPTFFFIRAAVFLAVWSGLALSFARKSRAQDSSGDPRLTESMQSLSPISILLFALSVTFAAFDWIMSLDPHWYSTIFGIYVFAGCATSSLAALALILQALQSAGIGGPLSTIEHRHDVGKLLFGFIVFWAYIAFSQFLLIWYANIPEETVYYRERWEGSWSSVSMLLLFGHFIIPFLLLMSRHAKRNPKTMSLGAIIMLVMHWVDMYWLVMPNYEGAHHHGEPSIVDFAGLLFPLGLGALVVTTLAKKTAAYPIKDPRMIEATHVENL